MSESFKVGVDLIIERAKEMGVTLRADGGTLRYYPKSRTPGDLVDALRQHKEEVLKYLSKYSAYGPTASLLGWASQFAQQDIVLEVPVTFVEAPLRRLTTAEVSSCVGKYLRIITRAQINQANGSWHPWTTEWWKGREEEAITALASLKQAIEAQINEEAQP